MADWGEVSILLIVAALDDLRVDLSTSSVTSAGRSAEVIAFGWQEAAYSVSVPRSARIAKMPAAASPATAKLSGLALATITAMSAQITVIP